MQLCQLEPPVPPSADSNDIDVAVSSVSSVAVSRDDILLQLQQMEVEIQRAKEVCIGGTGIGTGIGAGAKQSSSGTGATVPSLPKARAPLKNSSAHNTHNTHNTHNEGLVTPRGCGSPRGRGSPRGSFTLSSPRRGPDAEHNTHITHTQSTHGSDAVYEHNTSRNMSMISESGQGQTSPGPQKRTNLRIFRSPLNHQKHKNRNKFNETSMTWAPTGVSLRRNERFQTTEDLMIAKKINPVFYDS
jgi:hypothetical protein